MTSVRVEVIFLIILLIHAALDEFDGFDQGDDEQTEADGDEVFKPADVVEAEGILQEGHLHDQRRGDQRSGGGEEQEFVLRSRIAELFSSFTDLFR